MSSPTNHAGNDYAARLAAQSRTPEQYKVDAKIYFHHHNYAKFHFDMGGSNVKTVAFANHRYITDDKREQDQLNLVADVPGTFIYTIPDSDVRYAAMKEMTQESAQMVMKAAQARVESSNQPFDGRVPIVPINVQQVQHTPVQVQPLTQGQAVVGLQHSFSGTAATEELTAKEVQQTAPPNAAEEARARLSAVASQKQ